MHVTAKAKIHKAAGLTLACQVLGGTSPVHSGSTTLMGEGDGGTNEQVGIITVEEVADA